MTQKDAIKKFMKKWGEKRQNAVDFRITYDDTLKELDAFIRGEQWIEAINQSPWAPKPVNNLLHLVQQAKVAKISETELVTKLLPLAEEDIDTIEDMENMMDSFWKHSGVTHVISDVKQDSRVYPIGYLKIMFDGSALVGTQNNIQKGGFKFESINPANVFWDPKAYDIDKASFIYETKKVSYHDIKNTPKYNKEVVQDVKDWLDSRKTLDDGEIYNRNYDLADTDKKTFTLYVISFRWKPSPGADFKYGEIHTISKGGAKDDSIELEPLWAKADLKLKGHPIVPLREFKNAHEFMGRSSVQFVLDKQKDINKIDSIIGNIADQLSNQQKIVSVESGIDPAMLAKYGNAPGLVIATKSDVNNSMTWAKPPEISPSLLQHKKDSKEDMFQVSNITPASLGQNAGSQTTAGGTNSLIGQAEGIEVSPKQNYKFFIEQVYRRMMEYIVGNFTKITRRIDNHDPDKDISFGFKDFDIKTFKNKEFDMYIDVRATASEMQQQKQEVLQILGLQAQTGKQILSEPTIIKLMNFPDSDRILANYYDKKDEENESNMMQVATQAAMAMAQEIHTGSDDNENVSVQEMAQMAAQQAIQSLKKQSTQPQQSTQGGSPGVGQGASAPQPAAQAAQLQKTQGGQNG